MSIDKLRDAVRDQLADSPLTEEDFARVAKTHGEAASLVARRAQQVGVDSMSVGDLATVCRTSLAWDVESFYNTLDLDNGDYPGLMRLNGGEYVDIKPMDWDS